MNVEGPTYDDELITLIPELTPYFSNFINDTSWSNQYKKGMFLEQCEPRHYIYNDSLENDQTVDNQLLYYTRINTFTIGALDLHNSVTYDSTTGFLYIQLFSNPSSEDPETEDINFKLNSLFTKLNFNSNTVSNITIKTHIGDEAITTSHSSDKYRWSLVFVNDTTEIAEFFDNDDVKDYVDSDMKIFIKIFVGRSRTGNFEFLNFIPNLAFYREVSQEDIEFAKAAEECPWLENKLIDFTYFLENQMITSDEYRNLMNSLTQDLRIINGQLMFHAKAYYEALHKRTKLLADLTNQLDTLGAAANADIVTTLRTVGQITDDENIDSFRNAYRNTILSNVEKKQSLLNYDDILTDYFNKFFNSEQRFLKNIKKFKDYFNSVPTTWLDPATGFYSYTLTIENAANTSYIISDSYNKENLTGDIIYIQSGDKRGIPVFQIYYITLDQDNNIIEAQPYYPVTIENFNNYYIKNGDGTGKEQVQEGEKYNTA